MIAPVRDAIEERVLATGERRYRAEVWDARAGKRVRKTFASRKQAETWRDAARTRIREGHVLGIRKPTTLADAADALIEGMRSGAILNRSGQAFKPSVIRSYDTALKHHVLPDLGGARLDRITQRDVRELVKRLRAEGLAASTVRNAVAPLRVVYRQALEDGNAASNPVAGIRLPQSERQRDRIAAPDEAARLVAALPTLRDRALWTTAFFAGLRLGELRGLRWGDIDFDGGVIRVERAIDEATGRVIPPKSEKGRRRVPLVEAVKDALQTLAGGPGSGRYVFGGDAPFDATAARRRAARAWKAAAVDPIGFHEARHTYASLMIAAGVNAKALSTFMGHATITITIDRYGHLMPGSEAEAASLLEAYLARSVTPRLPLEVADSGS
jgi:integrase